MSPDWGRGEFSRIAIGNLKSIKNKQMKIFQFTAHIEKDADSGQYIGIIHSVPGAHTYADTLDELKKNLQEVVELCLENMTEQEINDIPEFIGTQQISVSL